ALLWFGRLPALIGFVLASCLVWLPAFLAWGPSAFLESFSMSQRVHPQAYYSLGGAAAAPGVRADPGTIDRYRLLRAAAVGVSGAAVTRSGRGVVVAGLAVFVV